MIGIGVTTHNRHSVAAATLDEIRKRMPPNARLVVVDDASAQPPPFEVTHRFTQNVGIARAKNKCLELLADCDHIFLFDDDTYPIANHWWVPYCTSPEPHLMYIFQDFANGQKLGDTAKIYDDGKHIAYSHARGCLLYFRRDAIDRVGGFDTAFGKWGWEHVNLSDRIHAAGLTTFAYMDVVNSRELIRAGDEYREVSTTVPTAQRNVHMTRNTPLYRQRAASQGYYVDYRDFGHHDQVIGCYFKGQPDPQRAVEWSGDQEEVALLRASVDAVSETPLVLINDCWDDVFTVATGKLSPYWQRWISIYEHLVRSPFIRNVWCVDATDVEMLRNPFPQMEPGVIYVGDEPAVTNIPWMRQNHPAAFIQNFIVSNGSKPLLNCGLLGGSRENVMEFIRTMLSLYVKNVEDVKFGRGASVGETDMGLFNFVARTHFPSRIEHGPKVNTTFKKFADNGQAWWRHK